MDTESVQPDRPPTEKSEARLVFALARGVSLKSAALESLVSISTIRRRLKNPEFKAKVTRARGQILDRSTGILAQATLAAAKGLKALADSRDESIRLAACRAILELSSKYRDQAEIIERLEALEGKQ